MKSEKRDRNRKMTKETCGCRMPGVVRHVCWRQAVTAVASRQSPNARRQMPNAQPSFHSVYFALRIHDVSVLGILHSFCLVFLSPLFTSSRCVWRWWVELGCCIYRMILPSSDATRLLKKNYLTVILCPEPRTIAVKPRYKLSLHVMMPPTTTLAAAAALPIPQNNYHPCTQSSISCLLALVVLAPKFNGNKTKNFFFASSASRESNEKKRS